MTGAVFADGDDADTEAVLGHGDDRGLAALAGHLGDAFVEVTKALDGAAAS